MGAVEPHITSAIDPHTITRFVTYICADMSGFTALRLLCEKGSRSGKPLSAYPALDAQLINIVLREAERASAQARGLFILPASIGKPGAARAQDLTASRFVIVDIDAGDVAAAKAHLITHLGEPGLIVASGGITDEGAEKLHLYWRLVSPVTQAGFKRLAALRATIAAKVGADPSLGRLTQPIRVPGSIYNKHAAGKPVRVLEYGGPDRDLADLEECAARMPPLTGAVFEIGQTGILQPSLPLQSLLKMQVHAEGVDGIARFDAIARVCGHWLYEVRKGEITLQDAWERVCNYNAACVVPPWSADRLRQSFDALHVRDLTQSKQRQIAASAGPAVLDLTPTLAQAMSEDALAGAFVAHYGKDWRHVAAFGHWLRWRKGCWHIDITHNVREVIRQTVRKTVGADQNATTRKLASARSYTAIAQIAASDPAIATAPDQLDHDPDRLNTPAGMIELSTGELLPHDRAALMTNMTRATPNGECPHWLRFLDQVANGDAKLIAYLQRVAGYCLSASNSEQVFFFLHGHGANGKSVFLNTLATVLGDYAAVAPAESFMAARQMGHPTDLAGLRGKRLVCIGETEAGRAWAEARIKAITGGEPIRARFMQRDFFEFTPSFKLVFAGNHRPVITGIGEAMRRRLHLIPFTVTIPVAERDPDLTTKLREESDGILNWMVTGHAQWRKFGLNPPEVVTGASADYLEDEDIVAEWLSACCRTAPELSERSQQLYSSWSEWATKHGHNPQNARWLGHELERRGFASRRTARARMRHGLSCSLNPANASEADQS